MSERRGMSEIDIHCSVCNDIIAIVTTVEGYDGPHLGCYINEAICIDCDLLKEEAE